MRRSSRSHGKSIGRHLLAILFPERCAACGEVIPYAQEFCTECRTRLPCIVPPVCPLCGRSEEACTCGRHRRHFDGCAAPFWYEEPIRAGILRFKTEGASYAAASLAAAMATVVRREYAGDPPVCVVPVPLSAHTRRERGFNQSERLAVALARELEIPMRPLLVKLVDTRPQKELPAWQRSGNLAGAFDRTPGERIPTGPILLVDDVSTTGSTLDECAKMLKIYGAERVLAVVAALPRLSK